MRLWDETTDLPLGRDGLAEGAGFIGSRAQAERWQALGYQIADAVDRYRAFLLKWESYKSEKRADDYCLTWFAAEAKRAVDFGIPEDDPDLWRIRAAAKYHEAFESVTPAPRLRSMDQDELLPLWSGKMTGGTTS